MYTVSIRNFVKNLKYYIIQKNNTLRSKSKNKLFKYYTNLRSSGRTETIKLKS